MPHGRQVKVVFRVINEDYSVDIETLWATPVGPDQYQLDNSPFYAYAVSWQDIVYAPLDREDGRPSFKEVVKKSGHRTIRIIFDQPIQDGNEPDAHLHRLGELGCIYEGDNRKLISVDIPPAIELETIRRYLIEHELQWEHADPTFEQLFPSE